MIKININIILFIDDILGLAEAHHVSFLEFAVILVILLDSIIGQMDEWLVDGGLVEGILLRGRPYVSFFE